MRPVPITTNDISHRPRLRRSRSAVAAAVLVTVAAACGSETAAPSTDETEPSSSMSVVTTLDDPSTGAETADPLADPDADWSSAIIDAYDDFLEGDLDRNLAFLDAVDAAPEREVELYVAYVHTLSDAVSGLIARFPDVEGDSDLARAAVALQDALTDRRDRLDTIAGEMEEDAAEVQTELDQGDDARYAEWRSQLAEDPSTEACFALQTELDRAELGLLRCIPGPDGDSADVEPATETEAIPLGDDPMPLSIDFEFDLDADEPSGTFDVRVGSDELGCRSGTWIDTELSEDMVELTKELTCTDGASAGAFTLVQRHDGSSVWVVTDATADFDGLAGTGTFAFDPSTSIETITGDITLP